MSSKVVEVCLEEVETELMLVVGIEHALSPRSPEGLHFRPAVKSHHAGGWIDELVFFVDRKRQLCIALGIFTMDSETFDFDTIAPFAPDDQFFQSVPIILISAWVKSVAAPVESFLQKRPPRRVRSPSELIRTECR